MSHMYHVGDISPSQAYTQLYIESRKGGLLIGKRVHGKYLYMITVIQLGVSLVFLKKRPENTYSGTLFITFVQKKTFLNPYSPTLAHLVFCILYIDILNITSKIQSECLG